MKRVSRGKKYGIKKWKKNNAVIDSTPFYYQNPYLDFKSLSKLSYRNFMTNIVRFKNENNSITFSTKCHLNGRSTNPYENTQHCFTMINNKTIILHRSEIKIEKILIEKPTKIGRGSFGVVYKGTITSMTGDKIPIAIKYIAVNKTLKQNLEAWNQEKRDFSQVSLNEYLDFEIETSYSMGQNNIGPTVYGALEVESKFSTDKPEAMIIIMDRYDGDVGNLLSKLARSPGTKFETDIKPVLMAMSILIRKMIFDSGFFCYDIKPGNFVYRKKNGIMDYRMIDFGTNFCSQNTMKTVYRYIYMFAIIMQMSIICQYIMSDCGKGDKYNVKIKQFYRESITSVKGDNETYNPDKIDKYIDQIFGDKDKYDVFNDRGEDVFTVLMHYGNMNLKPSMSKDYIKREVMKKTREAFGI